MLEEQIRGTPKEISMLDADHTVNLAVGTPTNIPATSFAITPFLLRLSLTTSGAIGGTLRALAIVWTLKMKTAIRVTPANEPAV